MIPKKHYPFASLAEFYNDLASHCRSNVSHDPSIDAKTEFKKKMRWLAYVTLWVKDTIKNDS